MNSRSSLLCLFQLTVRPVAFCALTVTFLTAASLRANEVQWRFCRAAMNLGQAEARLTLFGRLMNGQVPRDQEGSVLVNVSNAAAEIRAAMLLIQEPYKTEWSFSPQAVNNLLGSLDGFAEQTQGRNYAQRAAHLDGTRQVLRSIFSVTFMTGRGDALRSEGNCDRFIMDACYHFGKAATASAVDDPLASGYREGALGSVRLAINEGLAIAMDRDGHLPFDGHRKKECCTFGTPAQWAAFQAFPASSPIDVYTQKTGELLGIVVNANQLDRVCLGRAVNPWDEAAERGDKSREEKERHTKELVDGLIARGESALSGCRFAELQQILNQLAALAPTDPRYQSLRARSAQLLQREQEGLSLLREAGSYSDLDRTVQTLKQAQQKFPCPKPEVNQVIGSMIREAADQRRGVDVEQTRARQAAWTSVLGGIIQGIEQAGRTQSGGGTWGTGETTAATGTGGGAAATTGNSRQTWPHCNCANLNYGRITNHAVRGPSDVKCPPLGGAQLTQSRAVDSQPNYYHYCRYEMGTRPHLYIYSLDASWTRGSYLVPFARTRQGSYTIRANHNAVVSVDGGSYLRMPPSDCESLCRAAWDLLRQVEPLSAPASR